MSDENTGAASEQLRELQEAVGQIGSALDGALKRIEALEKGAKVAAPKPTEPVDTRPWHVRKRQAIEREAAQGVPRAVEQLKRLQAAGA